MDIGFAIPFAILRLRRDPTETTADIRVRLIDVGEPGERSRTLRIRWSPESVPKKSLQGHDVTHLAALAVAFAVLTRYTKLSVRNVATLGDAFDYWLVDGDRDFGFEVSGTRGQDLEARRRAKIGQLRGNPHGADGYVAVAGFDDRTAVLSFHCYVEDVS